MYDVLGLSYAIRLSPRIEKRLATLFTPSPSRVGHPGDPYKGQRLDAIDQKPKHDSSKTEITLDVVMQEAEGKRGKPGAKNKAETPQAKLFPLTNATLPK